MATVLETYLRFRNALDEQMSQSSITMEQIWLFEETIYRIGVLEVCQAFCKSAPVSQDTRVLLPHYQMLDAYVQNLALERQYGPNRGPDTMKEREAARKNLLRVITDYRKRFSSFVPSTPTTYRSEVMRMVNTFLPAWLQCRNTFVPLRKEKEVTTA